MSSSTLAAACAPAFKPGSSTRASGSKPVGACDSGSSRRTANSTTNGPSTGPSPTFRTSANSFSSWPNGTCRAGSNVMASTSRSGRPTARAATATLFPSSASGMASSGSTITQTSKPPVPSSTVGSSARSVIDSPGASDAISRVANAGHPPSGSPRRRHPNRTVKGLRAGPSPALATSAKTATVAPGSTGGGGARRTPETTKSGRGRTPSVTIPTLFSSFSSSTSPTGRPSLAGSTRTRTS